MLILVFIILCLGAYSGFITYHAYRWSKIIFMLEDDFSEAVEVHERSLETFDQILQLKLFFDSPQTKKLMDQVIDDIKLCRQATSKVCATFTQRSKRKYVRYEDKLLSDGET